MILNHEVVIKTITDDVKARCVKGAINVSGGIDSALVLKLMVMALGKENVVASYIDINSSQESLNNAKLVAEWADVPLNIFNLNETFYNMVAKVRIEIKRNYGVDGLIGFNNLLEYDPTILGSLRSILRTPIGRFMNRVKGELYFGTGNECEDRWVRFYQKGGDGEVDNNIIAFLSKGEVFQLAWYLGVPTEVLNATPSPDLWAGVHTDEDELIKYLNLPQNFPLKMYSYVDSNGRYKNFGAIERVSRFNDTVEGRGLFSGANTTTMAIANAKNSIYFADYYNNFEPIKALLTNAVEVELATRHKKSSGSYVPRETFIANNSLINLPIGF